MKFHRAFAREAVPRRMTGPGDGRLTKSEPPRRIATLLPALFSVGLAINLVAAAHRKPFWHDEIFTILFARLSSVSTMWQAACDGIDFMPPLNAIVTHFLRSALGDGPVVTRVPAMLGLWLACVCLLGIVRRRSNLALGLAAAMLPLWTAAFRYGVEARGYGLMLGMMAVSAFAWSEAARGRRRSTYVPLLALSLAAAGWAHYYGLMSVATLGLGEVVRAIGRRKVDWAMCGAFAAGMVFVVPLHDLVGVALAQAGRSWTLVRPATVRETYEFLVSPLLDARLVAVVVLLVVIGRLVPFAHEDPAQSIPKYEVVSAAASLFFPLLGVFASQMGAAGFVPRYSLGALVGIVPLVLLSVWLASRRSGLVSWVLAAFLAVFLVQSTWTAGAVLRSPVPNPMAERATLSAMLRRGEPVCVTGGLMYLQFWYYAPPELKPYLYYLTDPTSARQLMGTDSFETGFIGLRRWSAVTAVDYDRFIESHRHFVVYQAGTGWLLEKLSRANATMREIGVENGFRYYAVSLPSQESSRPDAGPEPTK